MSPRNDTKTATQAPEPGLADPLDAILRGLAGRAASPRVRQWAADLIDHGEGATGDTEVQQPAKGKGVCR
jgi:hypothetical protein